MDKGTKSKPKKNKERRKTVASRKGLQSDDNGEKLRHRSAADFKKKMTISIPGSPPNSTASNFQIGSNALIDQELVESVPNVDEVDSLKEKFPKLSPEFQLRVCKDIVEEYWTTAWKICSERFYQSNAPAIVSIELRDTWLRILETEWLDHGQSSEPLPTEMFRADYPPLPLAYDTWARGNLEIVPNSRRQSVVDPFLRDDIVGPAGDWEARLSFEVPATAEIDSKPPPKDVSKKNKRQDQDQDKPEVLEESKSPPKSKKDEIKEQAIKKKSVKPTSKKLKKIKDETKDIKEKRTKSQEEKAKEKVAETIQRSAETDEEEVTKVKPPERSSINPTSSEICEEGEELEGEFYDDAVFVPDFPYVCAKPQEVEVKQYYSWEVLKAPKNIPSTPSINMFEDADCKPWAPSECLEVDRNIVFRLANETSSEALLKRKQQEQAAYTIAGANILNAEYEGEDFQYYHDDEGQTQENNYEIEVQQPIELTHEQKKKRLQSVIYQKHAKTVASRIDNMAHAGSDEILQILAPYETRKFTARDSIMVEAPPYHPLGGDNNNEINQMTSKKFTLDTTMPNTDEVKDSGVVLKKAGRKTSILDMKDEVIKNRRRELKIKFSQEKIQA